MQPRAPCATWLRGAASSQVFMEPHSSASTCPNVIHLTSSTGMMRLTASDTSGNIWRWPVWKSRGSSATTRNWLNVKPAGGATSGTHVDSR